VRAAAVGAPPADTERLSNGASIGRAAGAPARREISLVISGLPGRSEVSR